jgi:hypothetical protein
MRIIERDPMARRFAPNANNCQIQTKKRSKEHMERRFLAEPLLALRANARTDKMKEPDASKFIRESLKTIDF